METLSFVAFAMMWAFIVLFFVVRPWHRKNLDEAICAHKWHQIFLIGIVVSAAVFLVASLAKDLTP